MSIFVRLTLLTTCLAFAPSCFARLGETEKQLIERYEKPVMRGEEKIIAQGKILTISNNLHFKSEDWNIIARLVDGRCESITYRKPGEWTEEQFRLVLESNGGRALWEERKTKTPKLTREWLRRDSTTAVWRSSGGITLETPAYRAAETAVKKQAKKDASKLPKI